MKNVYTFIFLFALIGLRNLSASVVIQCSARYQSEVVDKNPVGYCETPIFGRTPIFVSHSGSKKMVWSDYYSVEIVFFSGKEFNEGVNSVVYNENSIIAVIKWSNGGYTSITISDLVTNLDYMTDNEIKFNPDGSRRYYLQGYDSDRHLWELSF
ncbi:MAG TPA: hypothetical protein VMW01_09080 [Williamwhitmania sp.]|nr:hypothetical protein [Williamwhitmania sp.]